MLQIIFSDIKTREQMNINTYQSRINRKDNLTLRLQALYTLRLESVSSSSLLFKKFKMLDDFEEY